MPLTTGVFSDWMNVLRTLGNHEFGMEHNREISCWITRKPNKNTVNRQLEKQMKKNMQYYFEVLKRIVPVIKPLMKEA